MQAETAVVALDGQESLAAMQSRLAEMTGRLSLVQSFFKQVMQPGTDYDTIPGTDKPTLLKPGAEKLCEFYGYSIRTEVLKDEQDRQSGYCEYVVRVSLVSRRTGEVVAEGVGSANTYEGRYRYRWVWANQLPDGIDKSTLLTRRTRRGEVQYRVENDDLHSLWNTVLKMAKKRALIDATLSATRSSGIFTQDLEDLRKWAEAGAVIDAEFDGESGTYTAKAAPAKAAKPTNGNGRTPSRPAVLKRLREVCAGHGLDDEETELLIRYVAANRAQATELPEIDDVDDALLIELGKSIARSDSATVQALLYSERAAFEARAAVGESVPE